MHPVSLVLLWQCGWQEDKKLQNKMWQGKAMKDHPQQCTILTGAPVYKVCGYISFQSLTCHTATGTHMPYGITQCYLLPDRREIPTFTPAKAGTQLSNPTQLI